MIANINFCCDTPGCKSTCTISPQDAKDPVKALEARGWEVAPNPGCGDGTTVVEECICLICAQKKKCCPAGNCDKE